MNNYTTLKGCLTINMTNKDIKQNFIYDLNESHFGRVVYRDNNYSFSLENKHAPNRNEC